MYGIKVWLVLYMVELTDEILICLLQEAPRTANEIARIVGSHHFTVYKALMKLIVSGKPIRMKKIGRYEIFWYDFFDIRMKKIARELYGDTLTEEDFILIDLLEKNALNSESAVSIENYSKEYIKKHADEKRVVIEGNRVYLTEIGKKIAMGLKDVWGKKKKVNLQKSIAK